MKVCVEKEHVVFNGVIIEAEIKIESPSVSANILNLSNLSRRYDLTLEPRDGALIVYVPFCSPSLKERLQGLVDDIQDVDKTTLMVQGNRHVFSAVKELKIPESV